MVLSLFLRRFFNMLGFLNPSLEEREWITAQNKKIWWLMPLSVAVVVFVPGVFSLVTQAFWGVMIANIATRIWIHKAFNTQNFKNVILYKVVDTISFGFIIGYAGLVLFNKFVTVA